MECCINQQVDYLNLGTLIKKQRAAVMDEIHQISNSHVVYKGLEMFRNLPKKDPTTITNNSNDPNAPTQPTPAPAPPTALLINIADIPGVKEAGWTPQRVSTAPLAATTRTALSAGGFTDLHAKLGAILKQLKASKDAWPFLTAVDPKVVEDYYKIITRPMDLDKMTKRLNAFEYKSKEMFVEDFQLLVRNCQTYNTPDTSYWRSSVVIDTLFQKLIKQQFGDK